MSEGNYLPKDEKGFFKAGDVRVNENLALTSMHTLWVREHNRLCQEIKKEHPEYNDEDLFTAARNHVIGLIQKITYEDWLPKLIGKSAYYRQVGVYERYK